VGTVIFSWLTLADVKSREIGGEFFKLVEQRLGEATLERFGPTEPLGFTFKDSSIAADLWKDNLFWKGGKPRGSGAILHRGPKKHCNINLHFSCNHGETDAWRDFLCMTSELLVVDFSSLHFIGDASATQDDEIFEGVNSYDLQDGLRSLPWGICFGLPFIRMLSESKIESSGFETTKRLNARLIFAAMTSDVNDYVTDYEHFRQRQQAVVDTLGEEQSSGEKRIVSPSFQFA